MTVTIWISVGVLAIIGLLFLIYRQLQQLKRAQQFKLEEKARLEAQTSERYQYVKNSLQLLAQAVVDDQIDIVEGAIRIQALLGYYGAGGYEGLNYPVFAEITDKTAHIPIREAWKALDRRTKKRHEAFMEQLADSKRDAAKGAAADLLKQLA